MTSNGLRILQDLRRSLLEPPARLQPRTVTATWPPGIPATPATGSSDAVA